MARSLRNRGGNRRTLVMLTRRTLTSAVNGEVLETFTPFGSAYAAIHHRTAREIDATGRFQMEEDQYDFYFRYNDAVATMTGGDRMEARGLTYECAGNPKNTDQRNRELVVPARRMSPTTA